MKLMMTRAALARAIVLALAASTLGACGGGGGGGNVRSDPPPATTPPPATGGGTTNPGGGNETPTPTPPPVTPTMAELNAHLTMTRVYQAPPPPPGSSLATIGFLDSGVDPLHETLVGSLRNTYTSVDASRSNLGVADANGHGTNVARIALGTSLRGMPAGVAGGTTQGLSLRLLNDTPGTGADAQPYSRATNFDAAFQWFVNNGGKVLNVSGSSTWFNGAGGGPGYGDFATLVSKNRLVVVGTGDGSNQAQPSDLARLPFGPSGDPAGLKKGWIVTGAVDKTGTALASYSRPCGDARDNCLVAPGDVIVAHLDANEKFTYERLAGTDYATAQVSGAASRVWHRYPYFSQDLVRQTLLGAATDLGEPGVDAIYGWGLLDVAKAARGPSRLDWGDVSVVLGYNSNTSWDNAIGGDGGLDIDGNVNSTLYLTGNNTYTGKTRIHNGASVRFANGMASSVELADKGSAMLWSGVWKGDVDIGRDTSFMILNTPSNAPPLEMQGTIRNNGYLNIAAGARVLFTGSYVQGPNGDLSVYLGADPLHFPGTATLDGNFHISGVLSSYVPTTRKVILKADQGITGNFARYSYSPALTLNATFGGDADEVWLDITRLDIHQLTPASLTTAPVAASAGRVEAAFDQFDRDLASGASPEAAVLDAAGAIQRAEDGPSLAQTLSSLSGELHDADVGFAMQALEGGRHAVESRFDRARTDADRGAWSDSLHGVRGWSSYDVQSDGWVMGRDAALSNGLVAGATVSSLDSDAWHSARADREHNRQIDGQLYASMDVGANGYLLGLASFGRMQRDVQRELDLGDTRERVDAVYAQHYASFAFQGGYRVELGRFAITPYLGAVALRMARDGFREQDTSGFGLSAQSGSLQASQALTGARMDYGWNAGPVRLDLEGRAEWQRRLALTGDYQASFTALDAWSPIAGPGLSERIGLLSLGLNARFGRGSAIGLAAQMRRHGEEVWSDAMLRYSTGF